MAKKKKSLKVAVQNAAVAKSGSKKAGAKPEGHETACAVLSYLLIGIIWYFADDNMKKSGFVKRHASQGLVLLVAWLIAWVVMSIVTMVLAFLPMIGWFLIAVLWLLVEVFFVVFWVMGLVHAATGADKQLPFFGDYAEKLNF